MFRVYEFQVEGQPFPRTDHGIFETAAEVRERFHLTPKALACAIDGEHHRYVVDFDPAPWVHGFGGALDEAEIAEILGVSVQAVSKTLSRARRKLQRSALLRQLLHDVAEMKRDAPIEVRYRLTYTMKHGGTE